MSAQEGWRLAAKRLCDVTFAGVALAAALPVLGLVAFSVALSMGSPVLFRQQRPGRGGALFNIVKFRTMKDSRAADGTLLTDAERLTNLGRFLRASSLDELPQLWNVLRGELSLVGPRPLLPQYLRRYTVEQARRHDVMPGLTGWAQVNGRNALSWEEKLALDVWYVNNWSLILDVKILALTFVRVLRRDGVAQKGHVTMPEFMGNCSTESEDPTR